ncbi:DUF4962 domain-containing protein [Paenibacillus sp. MCAF20]
MQIRMLEIDDVKELAVGDSIQLKAYVIDQLKNVARISSDISFKSSHPHIAFIHGSSGEMKGLQPGEALLEAEYEGHKSVTRIMVKPAVQKPEWLKRLSTAHPRLMATSEDFIVLKQKINSDPQAKQWYESMKGQTLQLLVEKIDISVVDSLIQRMTMLALMYKIDGDSVYAERGCQELCQLVQLKSWTPDFFLDTSSYLMTCSIGYDWFYDFLTEDQRHLIRDAIVTKGLIPARTIYRYTPHAPYDQNDWPLRTNNWNLVSNGGVIMGALTVGEYEPAIANEVLEGAFRSMPRAFDSFAKDGGWNEGVAYWMYTWVMLSRALASLDTALGSDYHEFASYEGIKDSGYFPIYMLGPTGQYFNFADCFTELDIRDNEGIYWLANKFNLPELTKWRNSRISEAVPQFKNPMELLWYQPRHMSLKSDDLPLDKYYRGVEAATMRSAWNDTNALFVGVKAGDNQAPHAELDMGTFVLDALGERWIQDNGEGNRRWPDFWNKTPSGTRWSYYKKRAEGHNTLVINPQPALTEMDSNPDQDPMASGNIIQFQSTPRECRAIQAEAKFKLMDAKPLPTSPNPDIQWKEPQWTERSTFIENNFPEKKLAIQLHGKKIVRLSVLMVPLTSE